MIRIVADLGNTRFKCGILDDSGRIARSFAWPVGDPDALVEGLQTLEIDWKATAWAVSSVNPPVAQIVERILKNQSVNQIVWFNSGDDVGVRTLNRENDKAGADRALAVAAAIKLIPRREPRFVVCCGTAITVERIGADDVWHGGAIAPGLRMIAGALAEGTAQLPEVDLGGIDPPSACGATTLEAIRGGILWFAAGGVRMLLERQAEELGVTADSVVFTGGDAESIAPLALGVAPGSSRSSCFWASLSKPSGSTPQEITIVKVGEHIIEATWLTPPGPAAISVLEVWGPGAAALVDSVFRPAKKQSLLETPPGKLRLGRIGAGLGDEVLAVLLEESQTERQGASRVVEIHCHGGPAARALVASALTEKGVRLLEGWSRGSRLRASRIKEQAEFDLAHASTLRSAEILLEQTQGALERELTNVLAQIELDALRSLAVLESLLARADLGTRLVRGWRIALAGKPNVGKSSLLNAIAGYARALVHHEPGTTRDLVTVSTAVDGWPVVFVDTAGLRATIDPVEAAGVELARSEQDEADLVLVVLDGSNPLDDSDMDLLCRFKKAIKVANKCDLAVEWDPNDHNAIAVSAQNAINIHVLLDAISKRIAPDPPTAGVGVPFREEHSRLISLAIKRLGQGNPYLAKSHVEALLGIDGE